MKILTSLLVAASMLAATAARAAEVTPPADLTAPKYAVQALDELAADGTITGAQAELGTARYLAKAKELAGRDVPLTELAAFQPPSTPQPVKLTALQKFAGFITFVNVLWVFGIIVLVASVTYLFGDLIVALMGIFVGMPFVVYEVLCYVASGALVAFAGRFGDGVTPYVALTGCLFLGGAMTLSTKNREWKSVEGVALVLALAWGAVAVFYGSSLVGFFSVIALMTALGFSGAVIPMGYVIGFKDKDSLGRATAAGFLILTAFVLVRIFGQQVPHVQVFESGALFMGSFVGYLGLLISASRYYDGGDGYVARQLVVFVAGGLALFVGLTWHIPMLPKIGGTFFALYLVEKFTDIPAHSARSYAVRGLVLSGLIYGFCVAVKQNPDAWRPYLPL